MSHKVGRLLVPYALAAILVVSALLAPRSPFYAVALAAQLGFYALAGYGAYLSRRDQRRADEDVERAPAEREPAVDDFIKGTTT
jgi:hypothetical protein